MAGIEDLVNLGNLIGQVRGQKTTTTQKGGTTRETTQTDVSDEGINELIRGILEGPGGVQNIGSAARSAGVYDSATEDLLLSNLYARASAQGELARSPTTRETETPDVTTTIEQPGIGMGPLAGTLAATTLAAPLVNRASQFLSGGGGAAGAAGSGGGITGLVSNLFSGGSGAGAATQAGAGAAGQAAGAAGSSFLTRSAGAAQGAAQGALSGAATQGAAIPGGFMSAVDTGGIGTGGAGGGIAAGATSFLGGLQGQRLSPMDVGTAIASGFAVGGPVGAGVAAIGTVLGNLGGKAIGQSVICTALMERGLLDAELYAAGAEYLAEVDPDTANGYYYWAVGVANKIRSGSRLWTALCLPLARSRTSLLASKGTLGDHIRYPLGTLTKLIGEPACWVIGKVLAARERIYG